METIRCFIAIDLPEEVKKEMINVQNQLVEFQGKLIEKENLHLTLKFLGEIDEETINKVKERLKKIKFKKFKAKLGEIGVFSESFIKIIWIKLENCDELQKIIDNSLKDLFKKEERFMSHMTIARVKFIKDRQRFLELLKKVKISPLEFKIDKFSLKKSELSAKRPIYGDLLEIKLV